MNASVDSRLHALLVNHLPNWDWPPTSFFNSYRLLLWLSGPTCLGPRLFNFIGNKLLLLLTVFNVLFSCSFPELPFANWTLDVRKKGRPCFYVAVSYLFLRILLLCGYLFFLFDLCQLQVHVVLLSFQTSHHLGSSADQRVCLPC